MSPRRQTGLHPKSHVPAPAPPPVLPGGETLRASMCAIDMKCDLWYILSYYLSIFACRVVCLFVCQDTQSVHLSWTVYTVLSF